MVARRLLVVDDALIIREVIKDAAAAAGWKIVGEAADGAAAAALYAEHRPDAVTLDLVMPVHDGLHGLRAILAQDPQAKVVIVSALEQKAILKQTLTLGAADFIVKPFDKHALVDTLDQLVPCEA